MTSFTGQAVYRQIVDDLRNRIREGDLKPGSQLPSMAELMRQYEVSQTVVKRAVAELKSAGDVYGHQGKAVYVQDIPRASRIRRIPRGGQSSGGSTFAAEMASLGLQPHTELVKAEAADAPTEVAQLLNIETGGQALVRKRHMYGSNRPVQLATAYIPMAIAGDESLAFPDAGPTEMYRRLGERGHRPVRFVEQIEVRRPTAEESEFLQLTTGVPVFVVTRTAYDHADTPVEATTNVLASNQWLLTYEWREDHDQQG